MKRKVKLGLVVGCLLAGMCGTPASGAEMGARPVDVCNAKQWEELQGGEPVLLADASAAAEGKKKRILAGIIIKAGTKAVWDVVCDKEAAVEYVKNLKRAVILEEGVDAGLPYQRVEQDMKLGLLPGTFNYVVRHKLQPYDRIDFKRESGDLKDIEGYWRFVPLEGGRKTLLVYQLHIVPGMFIPGIVVRGGLKKSLPEALTGIRDRVAAIEAGEIPSPKG